MRREWKLVVPLLAAGLVVWAGCKSSKPKTAADQTMIGPGDDIALVQTGGVFGEPLPEDALVLKDVFFDYDKSDIKASDKATLEGINSWMMNHPQALLQVEGHCDERGTKEYNMALGERRAQAIRAALVGLGVSPDRIQTISYGEEKPLCAEHVEDCWKKNRRGHFLADYGTGTKSASLPVETPREAKQSIEQTPAVQKVVQAPREEMPSPEEQATGHDRAIGRYHY
jgi:peptidoglycan-associated lipoprotein